MGLNNLKHYCRCKYHVAKIILRYYTVNGKCEGIKSFVGLEDTNVAQIRRPTTTFLSELVELILNFVPTLVVFFRYRKNIYKGIMILYASRLTYMYN